MCERGLIQEMPDINKDKTCCFFGHRKIEETPELKTALVDVIEDLIINKDIDTFLFGSKSQFDDLCYDAVSELKNEHPEIKRIYVRAENEYIDGEGSRAYREGLYELYEDTYFPEHVSGAGKASYVERNQEMINHSKFCVVYYDENYLPPRRKNSRRDLFDYQPKSGTAVAYDYAVKKKKEIINIYKIC